MPVPEEPPVEEIVPHQPKPLRRRKAILTVLWIAFALWIGALLAMYFGTVYPQRHPHDGRPAIIVPPARG